MGAGEASRGGAPGELWQSTVLPIHGFDFLTLKLALLRSPTPRVAMTSREPPLERKHSLRPSTKAAAEHVPKQVQPWRKAAKPVLHSEVLKRQIASASTGGPVLFTCSRGVEYERGMHCLVGGWKATTHQAKPMVAKLVDLQFHGELEAYHAGHAYPQAT